MATKYLIKKVRTCPVCNGKKAVQHPAWEEYWKEHAGKPLMTAKEDRRWFEAHGWSSGYCRIPYEEIPCGECDGEGELISEVDLQEALPDLQQEIQRLLAENRTLRNTLDEMLTDTPADEYPY